MPENCCEIPPKPHEMHFIVFFAHFIDDPEFGTKKRAFPKKDPFTRTLYENEKNFLFEIHSKYRVGAKGQEIIVVNVPISVVNL